MNLGKKHHFAFFVDTGFEVTEFTCPYDILKRFGAQITIFSNNKKKVVSSSGFSINVDDDISNINVKNYSGFILPGGPGIINLLSRQSLLNVIKEFYHSKKLVAGICAATLVFNAAGLIGKKTNYTTYPSVQKGIENGIYHEKEIIEDKNLLTASGPGFSFAFGFAIAKRFYSEKKIIQVKADFLLY